MVWTKFCYILNCESNIFHNSQILIQLTLFKVFSMCILAVCIVRVSPSGCLFLIFFITWCLPVNGRNMWCITINTCQVTINTYQNQLLHSVGDYVYVNSLVCDRLSQNRNNNHTMNYHGQAIVTIKGHEVAIIFTQVSIPICSDARPPTKSNKVTLL